VRKFVINQILVVLLLTRSESPSEGVIQERIKVFEWPLPSCFRPKRITKRKCDRHAQQDTVKYKSI